MEPSYNVYILQMRPKIDPELISGLIHRNFLLAETYLESIGKKPIQMMKFEGKSDIGFSVETPLTDQERRELENRVDFSEDQDFPHDYELIHMR